MEECVTQCVLNPRIHQTHEFGSQHLLTLREIQNKVILTQIRVLLLNIMVRTQKQKPMLKQAKPVNALMQNVAANLAMLTKLSETVIYIYIYYI